MKIFRFRHLALAASAILVAVIWSQSLYAQTAKEVGWVESLTNETSNYMIERDDVQYPVQIFTTVFVGDRIIIIPDDAENPGEIEIVLRIGNNKKQTISLDESPFVVPDTIESISISKNLFSWLKDFFLLPHEEETRVVTMTVRGETPPVNLPSFLLDFLLIPEGAGTTTQIGHRLLHIEWIGGVPPFELDVYSQGEKVATLGSELIGTSSLIDCLDRNSDSIKSNRYRVHRLELPASQLTVGEYVIYLSDAIGNVAVGPIAVVPQGTNPSSTEGEITPEHLTPLVALVSALKSGKKELLFDARQLIGDFSAADYPTRLLGRKLICQSVRQVLSK